uniref:Coiled-coil domain-containing protein 93 n=1 Tax=Macrostomum lignano TaxID=282301 RepID=A0A1I8IN10_9PLAT
IQGRDFVHVFRRGAVAGHPGDRRRDQMMPTGGQFAVEQVPLLQPSAAHQPPPELAAAAAALADRRAQLKAAFPTQRRLRKPAAYSGRAGAGETQKWHSEGQVSRNGTLKPGVRNGISQDVRKCNGIRASKEILKLLGQVRTTLLEYNGGLGTGVTGAGTGAAGATGAGGAGVRAAGGAVAASAASELAEMGEAGQQKRLAASLVGTIVGLQSPTFNEPCWTSGSSRRSWQQQMESLRQLSRRTAAAGARWHGGAAGKPRERERAARERRDVEVARVAAAEQQRADFAAQLSALGAVAQDPRAAARLDRLVAAAEELRQREAEQKATLRAEAAELEAELARLRDRAAAAATLKPRRRTASALPRQPSRAAAAAERLAAARAQLAEASRACASLRRRIDEFPSQEEASQYMRRLLELAEQAATLHRQTKQFYCLYNSACSLRELLEREIQLLTSADGAVTGRQAGAGRTAEKIVESARQNQSQAERRLTTEKAKRDGLNSEYLRLVESERRYNKLVKDFRAEAAKNERLRSAWPSRSPWPAGSGRRPRMRAGWGTRVVQLRLLQQPVGEQLGVEFLHNLVVAAAGLRGQALQEVVGGGVAAVEADGVYGDVSACVQAVDAAQDGAGGGVRFAVRQQLRNWLIQEELADDTGEELADTVEELRKLADDTGEELADDTGEELADDTVEKLADTAEELADDTAEELADDTGGHWLMAAHLVAKAASSASSVAVLPMDSSRSIQATAAWQLSSSAGSRPGLQARRPLLKAMRLKATRNLYSCSQTSALSASFSSSMYGAIEPETSTRKTARVSTTTPKSRRLPDSSQCSRCSSTGVYCRCLVTPLTFTVGNRPLQYLADTVLPSGFTSFSSCRQSGPETRRYRSRPSLARLYRLNQALDVTWSSLSGISARPTALRTDLPPWRTLSSGSALTELAAPGRRPSAFGTGGSESSASRTNDCRARLFAVGFGGGSAFGLAPPPRLRRRRLRRRHRDRRRHRTPGRCPAKGLGVFVGEHLLVLGADGIDERLRPAREIHGLVDLRHDKPDVVGLDDAGLAEPVEPAAGAVRQEAQRVGGLGDAGVPAGDGAVLVVVIHVEQHAVQPQVPADGLLLEVGAHLE